MDTTCGLRIEALYTVDNIHVKIYKFRYIFGKDERESPLTISLGVGVGLPLSVFRSIEFGIRGFVLSETGEAVFVGVHVRLGLYSKVMNMYHFDIFWIILQFVFM